MSEVGRRVEGMPYGKKAKSHIVTPWKPITQEPLQ